MVVYFTPTVGEFRPGRNTTVTSPTNNLFQELRGGSWYVTVHAYNVSAAFRYAYAPLSRYDQFGFRLTQSGCRQSIDRA